MLTIPLDNSTFLDGYEAALMGKPKQPPTTLNDNDNLVWSDGWNEGWSQYQPSEYQNKVDPGQPLTNLSDPQIKISNTDQKATCFAAEDIGVSSLMNGATPIGQTDQISLKKLSQASVLSEAAREVYCTAFDAAKATGKNDEESDSRAIKEVQNAGFYKTTSGWKQLAPDVRNKVNLREPILQPNGKYVIEDVDVFYPNAVKGDVKPLDPEFVNYAISNTNKSVSAGAQIPPITIGHPNELQKNFGVQLKAMGSVINWRPSSRGNGMVAADLVDVDPNVVKLMQQQNLTGLSSGIEGALPVNAGLVSDANKTNMRFGHVALLGGTAQALSQLPRVEVFSANNVLYFAADPLLVQQPNQKDKPMPAGMEHHSKLGDAHLFLGQAHKAFAAGEPGSEDKVKQGKCMLYDATAAYEGANMAASQPGPQVDSSPKAPANQNPIAVKEEGAGSAANEKKDSVAGSTNTYAAQPGAIKMPEGKPEPAVQDNKPVPQAVAAVDPAKPSFGTDMTKPQFENQPVAAFEALKVDTLTLKTENDTLKGLVTKLSTELKSLTNKSARADFEAQLVELEKSKYLPAKEALLANFEAALTSPTPAESIKTLIDMLKVMPAKPVTPAQVTVFDALNVDNATQNTVDSANEALSNVQKVLGNGLNTNGLIIKNR
jgi:hypothetical protein